jgi:Leucine-rich repeat (LRR) protein
MGFFKEDAPLCVKTDENNVEVRNYNRFKGDSEGLHHCKLNDFFSNNIDFEINKISVLQLDNCDISEIPHNIHKLNLKQLILTHNKLREVPSCLYSGLKTLELLDLSHNFIETFDIEPACSGTIKTLKLSDNKIRNFPHWILTLPCPQLVEVNYCNNFMVELKPTHELTIRKLELCNAQLRDSDCVFLKGIKTLEYLDVSNDKSKRNYNRFNNVPKLFVRAKWRNLKILKANNVTVSILPQEIFRIATLTELHLINCDLSWIPEEIKNFKNLKILDVSNNTLCSLPAEVSSLENLSVVKAPFNYISLVAEFTNLEVLDLYSNSLETVPSCMKNVCYIDLEKNYFDMSLHESYEKYKVKREQLRQMLDHVRTDGPRLLPVEENFVANLDSYSEEFANSDNETYDVDTESECWDDEEPIKSKERNSEITPSDDEWDAKIPTPTDHKHKPKSVPRHFEAHEDWIFCDVEEE